MKTLINALNHKVIEDFISDTQTHMALIASRGPDDPEMEKLKMRLLIFKQAAMAGLMCDALKRHVGDCPTHVMKNNPAMGCDVCGALKRDIDLLEQWKETNE